MKRPKSVTIIAWILIVRSGLSLLGLVNWLGSQRPTVSAFVAVNNLTQVVLGGVVIVVSGAAILKGLNWGRVLYLCCIPAWIIYNGVVRFVLLYRAFDTITGSIMKVIYSKLVLEIAFYIVILVFLTRPAASAFFTRRDSEVFS